ncbi:MAG: ABC-F family ATP-binding cassette domain-containing protein [Candidatus Pacebacteria bacterium]|nr:ABC-F family ATP-binding cassette domain-containing protein [Candidatus Paceibacterota bacterium]
MAKGDTVISFEKTSFEYSTQKPILDAVDFSVRRGTKSTFMGQNGAGKSTIFQMIVGELKPDHGRVVIAPGLTIALSHQVIPREELACTVREFFLRRFSEKIYDIDPRIDEVLEVVNLKGHEKLHERVISSFSGGQQARLLLASALIQNPDLLLLDEPTNNLDKAGIEHLTQFLVHYDKTVIVISHDEAFLNAFTDTVLYLDVHTRKVEQYSGNYLDVVAEIALRVEKERRKNAQLEKKIQDDKDKANFFAHKGGKMRLVARKRREEAEELEANKVDVRKEDKTIRPFTIPVQHDLTGEVLTVTSCRIIDPKKHTPVVKKVDVVLRRGNHLLLKGPNGIGKSTLLEAIATREAVGSVIGAGVKVGYYRQDFSTLNFEETVYESLMDAMEMPNEEKMRSVAAGFLITGQAIKTTIGNLSEGQKGLVAFARLVLEQSGLLILDEPTNHINFRHIPEIAKALDAYQGAMVLVSHVPDFVARIRIDEVLDLEKKFTG